MPIAYAPQQPSRFDSSIRDWVPTMNLDPAKRFGDVKVVLPPGANHMHAAPLIAALAEGMKNFCADDYLIAVGDPTMIAAAACIAHQKTGVLRLLKWDRLASDYISVELKI